MVIILNFGCASVPLSTNHCTVVKEEKLIISCPQEQLRNLYTQCIYLFIILDTPAQAINSAKMFACPGERLCFTCVAKDTSTLSWISAEYIDMGQLNVSSNDQHRAHNSSELSVVVTHTFANGTSLLTSILPVTILPNIMNHSQTITCQNVDIGTASNVVIKREGMCSECIFCVLLLLEYKLQA